MVKGWGWRIPPTPQSQHVQSTRLQCLPDRLAAAVRAAGRRTEGLVVVEDLAAVGHQVVAQAWAQLAAACSLAAVLPAAEVGGPLAPSVEAAAASLASAAPSPAGQAHAVEQASVASYPQRQAPAHQAARAVAFALVEVH